VSCSDEVLGPATIILQWDYVNHVFGELRAVPNTNDVSDSRFHHVQALRLHAGAVSQIDFAAMDGVGLLLIASHTSGVSCFEWDFEQVVGMHGVQGIAANAQENTAYAVFSGDGSRARCHDC